MVPLTSPKSSRTDTSRRVWEAIPWGAISSGAGRFLDFASLPLGGSYWTIAKGVTGVFARRAGRRFPGGGEGTGAVKFGAAESVDTVELDRP